MKVLFVDVGNTCRSVIAEHLARRFTGLDARSAGIRAQRPEDAKQALDTLRRVFGIDVPGHFPTNAADHALATFDVVVAIEDKNGPSVVTQRLKELGLAGNRIERWRIDDPWDSNPDQYDETARQVRQALARLVDSKS